MLNLPNMPVLNKIAANNARIAPNSTTNNTVVDHQNFSMLHPQRASESTLMDVLNQLDLNNPSQDTNGVIKGHMKDGSGDFMVTPGVIKFHKGGCQQPQPPVCDTPPPPPSYPPAPVPVTPPTYSTPTPTSSDTTTTNTSTTPTYLNPSVNYAV